MLTHVEMAPAAGFKLFGKVITQTINGNADAAAAAGGSIKLDQSQQASIFRRAHIEPEHTSAPHQHPEQELKQEEQDHEMHDRITRENDGQSHISPPQPQQEASAAAAESRASAAPLPCPRCRSRDTKFCYFNNYNVNQPRHFCKACHRYWTAGGALRNVPVGAGRRKNRPIGPTSAAIAGHRTSAGTAGFVLGFPKSSPASPSPGYTDRAERDRWFVRTEPPVGSDRRF